MKRYTTLACLALLTLSLTGCGDSEQMQMERARIALANAKPGPALEAVQPILEENPDHREARLIKAEAQMQQLRVDAARNSIHTLLRDLPDDPEARDLAVNLTYMRLREVQGRSDSLTNPELEEQFNEAYAYGQDQADWLIKQGQEAEAELLRARLANERAMRLRDKLMLVRQEIAKLREKGEALSEQQLRLAEALPDQVIQAFRDTLDHLQIAVKREPTLEGAGPLYTRMATAFRNWDQLAAYAQTLSEADGVESELAESVATAVLRIPDDALAPEPRRALAWSVMDSVAEDKRDTISWMLTAARLHMVAGRHDQAQPLLRRVMAKRADHKDGRYLLAQSLFNTEDYAEARKILDVLATENRNDAPIQTLYGLVLSKLDESVLAKEAFRQATQIDPDNRRAREGFLMLMAQQGHLNEAAGDVDAFYRLNPQHPEHIRFKMQYDIARGNRTEVRRLLDSVTQQESLTAEHYRVLTSGYAYLNDYESLIPAVRRLVEIEPDNLQNQLSLVAAMLVSGNDEAARERVEQLRAAHPDLGPTDRLLAGMYAEQGQYGKAIQLLEPYLEINGQDAEARLMLARSMVNLGLSQEALRQVANVLDDDPDSLRANALAARVYLYLGQPQRAQRHLRQIDARQLDPVKDAALLAQVALAAGEPRRALDVCNRAIAAGNTDPAIRLVLAATHRNQGNLEEAEQTLLAMVRSQPNAAAGYARLAKFYAENDMVDKGLIALRRLQAYDDTLALRAQASLLTREGRFDAARQRLEPLYERHLGLQAPVALTIADGLANIELTAGNVDEAVAVFEPMFNIGTLEFPARLRQVDLLIEQQRNEEAGEKLDVINRKLTQRLTARQVYEIANRYNEIGQQGKAAAVIEQKLAENPEGAWVLLLWRGELELASGRIDAAIETLDRASEMRPGELSILRRTAQAHEMAEDYVGAEKVYQRIIETSDAGQSYGLSNLAQMYARLGLNREARGIFERMNDQGVFLSPETQYTIGRVMFALEEYELARERFLAVPPRNNRFVAAQAWVALIEVRSDQEDQARRRVRTFAGNRAGARFIADQLLSFGLARPGVSELFGWADDVIDTATLPVKLRSSWLRNRLVVAGRERNWPLVLRSLEEMSDIEGTSLAIDALRVALMARMERRTAAQTLLEEQPDVADSPVAGLLAVMVGREPTVDPREGLRSYIAAIATADTQAAQQSVDYVRPYRTIFASDLRAMAKREIDKPRELAQHLATSLLALGAGMPTLCFAAAEDALGVDPGNVLALSLMTAGAIDDGQSLELLHQQAKEAAPDSALALFLTGQMAGGDSGVTHDQAAEAYRAVLERNPGNIHAKYLLSQQLKEQGNTDAALDILAQLRETSGTYKLLAQNDAAYIMAIHKPDQIARAASLARAAFQQAPGNIALLDTIGWIEHLTGDHDAAIDRINRALARGLSGVPEVQFHAGEIYKALGNTTWARRHYRAAADGDPDQQGVAQSKKALEEMGESESE